MARSLLDLAKSCERRAARISDSGNEAKKRKVLAALRYLVSVTPVDTSRALSNWSISVGTPPSGGMRGAFYPGVKGSTRGPSGQAAIAWGLEALAQVKAGWPVYLSNRAPYIRKLDEGSSSQHPGGFVEGAKTLMRNTP